MKVRDRYSKIKVQLKNALKGLMIVETSISDIKRLIYDNEQLIEQIESEIKALNKQMKSIINATDKLKENYKKITGVIGVGPITAIKCIIETGSSIKGKTKTSPLCNKSLKGIFYKAAWSTVQHDPQLKKYYKRKRGEGKHKLSVANVVANKVILRIFAVQKRKEPYVKLVA